MTMYTLLSEWGMQSKETCVDNAEFNYAEPDSQYIFDSDIDSGHLGYDSDSYSDADTIIGDSYFL